MLNLLPVPFRGTTLYVVDIENVPYTPMKPIVEGMGLDWSYQFRKVTEDKKRWGIAIIAIPSLAVCRLALNNYLIFKTKHIIVNIQKLFVNNQLLNNVRQTARFYDPFWPNHSDFYGSVAIGTHSYWTLLQWTRPVGTLITSSRKI